MNAEKQTYVYIIGTATESGGVKGPVKIGVTSSPDARLATLSTGSPRALTFACVVGANSRDVAHFLENAMHQKFADRRLNGEWFDIGVGVATQMLIDIFDDCLLALVAKNAIDWHSYRHYIISSGVYAIRRRIDAENYQAAWEAQAA